MYRTALLIVILLLPTASATSTFDVPSQWLGDVEARGSWALVLIRPDGAVQGEILSPGHVLATEHHVVKGNVRTGLVGHPHIWPVDSSQQDLDGLAASVTGRDGWKSIYIQADSIVLRSAGSGELQVASGGSPAIDLLQQSYPYGIVRPFGPTVGEDSAVIAGNFPVSSRTSIVAKGVHTTELHNITLDCQGPCPKQTEPTSQSQSVDRRRVDVHTLNYLDLATSSGDLQIDADAIAVAFGGSRLDAVVDGQVRLTGFSIDECNDAGCVSASGETLVANGTVQLGQLQRGPSGRLGGNVVLASGAARLDETVFDAGILGPGVAIASAVAVGGLLLAKAAGLLFTRVRSNKALEHPNRTKIHDAVTRRPGISFNELRRTTGLANGTIRHHLQILQDLDLIEARSLGQYARFYPRGTRAKEVEKLAVLQSGGNLAVYHLVQVRPGISQQEVLDAFAGQPRSSVQFRLKALALGGLIRAERAGNRLRYAPQEPVAQAVLVPSPMPG